MTTTELQQYKEDLAVRKRGLTQQVKLILDANAISSRGKNRVFEAIAGFPDVKPPKITDATESALVTLLFEIKNVQIAMYTIESAIEQATQKGE